MYLQPEFAATLSERQRDFSFFFHLNGEIYRQAPARKTLKFDHCGKHYFLKVHTGVGWKEIFKNLLQLRLPIISAGTEWNALHRLREIGIDTVTPVGYGCEGRNPAHLRSFLITEDLGDTMTLEDLALRWKRSGLPSRSEVAFKRRLLQRIAAITRAMHDNGINHRDLYLCHWHIPAASLAASHASDTPRIYIMDLHRAQIRRHPPGRRWIVKDLAGLLFSSMDLGLTQRDRLRFATAYSGLSLRAALGTYQRLWRQVNARARRLHDKHHRPEAQKCFLATAVGAFCDASRLSFQIF